MTASAPSALVRLLSAGDPGSQDQAWDAFVRTYSALLISTARKFGGDHDAAMDRYAYLLEQLRRDDFKRLRGYVAERRSKFTTWLVVVVRRLCLDYRRQCYGRPRRQPDGLQEVERLGRKRLADFIAEDLDRVAGISADAPDPEMTLRVSELQTALNGALRNLPPRDRLLLAFRYEQEMSAREIARLMDFPSVFHVYRRLNALTQSLRESLEGSGVDGASP